MESVRGYVTKNVGEMTDRVMIDLFKKKIQEAGLNPKLLKGTWQEASDILESHFGKISRVMANNSDKLRTLYKAALKEMRKVH